MQLSEVLRLFDSPLSQEQCWSICYGACRTLIKKKWEDHQRKERIKYILNLESLILTQRGEIEILHSEPNFQEIQKDSELVFAVGNLLCRCLDHGLSEEEICEVRFQDDLAELIGGMVLQNSEFDEGIGDADSLGESWESRKFTSSHYRSFRSLAEVVRFCDARLLRRNIDKTTHYLNVSKALYIEASELKAFLGHVLHDFEAEKQISLDNIEGPKLAKRYLKEWAKFWLKVMNELRYKTKYTRDKLTPEDYQTSPFEMMSNSGNTEDFRGKKMSRTTVERADSLPVDAEDRIYNFLRSRVSSSEELKVETDLVKAIESDNNVPDHANGRIINNENLPADIPMKEPVSKKMSKWEDYSLDDTLEEDFLNGTYDSDDDKEPAFPQNGSNPKKKLFVPVELLDEKQTTLSCSHDSISLTELTINNQNTYSPRRNTIGGVSSNKWISKSEINLQDIDLEDSSDNAEKIGSSLTEIFKIRQEITRSEVELIKNHEVTSGKKCFSCLKSKFTLFNRGRTCTVCCRKYCLKCMKENTDVPTELVKATPPNIGVRYSGNPSPLLNSSQHLHRSMFNLGGINDTRWFKRNETNVAVQLNMCIECEHFLRSIINEKSHKQTWTVQLQLDL